GAGNVPASGASAPPGAANLPGAAALPGAGVGPAGAGQPAAFPGTGAGTWLYAMGVGAVAGRGGVLRRFRVAVEDGAGQDPGAFAAAVEAVFADPRGWTAARQLRLQRVPPGVAAQFTIFLATAGTSERMCATGGLRTNGFTNCRLPGQVIINLARWWRSVSGYGAPLAEYQAYAINHEVGHQLGLGHEACPAAGRPAPVMQQQTLGLRGCRANGWPFLGGRRYSGRRVP
ncbi:MAG TPA: DUF3152 domain-containing protein, partial [Pilimelia sp.]|nr:DUF3152 domain-containing protein [Pilimelia sp.]